MRCFTPLFIGHIFRLEAILSVNCGSHSDYQNFIVKNLRKYYPNSDSKYERTVYLVTKDNPRLINISPRNSDEWKTEFNARTSVERSNKRKKYDFY